jgi:hypothetical protein
MAVVIIELFKVNFSFTQYQLWCVNFMFISHTMSHFQNMNAADLLKTHVTRIINHGHGGFHTFVDICQYSHDPNLTLNVLLKTFLHTSRKM